MSATIELVEFAPSSDGPEGDANVNVMLDGYRTVGELRWAITDAADEQMIAITPAVQAAIARDVDENMRLAFCKAAEHAGDEPWHAFLQIETKSMSGGAPTQR